MRRSLEVLRIEVLRIEALLQWRSLRFRVGAALFLVISCAPPILVALIVRGTAPYDLGAASYFSWSLDCARFTSLALAMVVAGNRSDLAGQSQMWPVLSAAGVSNGGFLWRRWAAMSVLLGVLTAVPVLVSVGVTLAVDVPVEDFRMYLVSWLLLLVAPAVMQAAMWLAAVTIAGGELGAFLMLAIGFGAAKTISADVLRPYFGSTLQLDWEWLGFFRLQWAINGLLELGDANSFFGGQHLATDGPLMVRQALEWWLLRASPHLALAALLLVLAAGFLRRTRRDSRPLVVGPEHPLRNLMRLIHGVQHRYTPDAALGREWPRLAAASLLCAGAVAWHAHCQAFFTRLADERYRVETETADQPTTALGLVPTRRRIAGELRSDGTLAVTTSLHLEHHGEQPVDVVALQLNRFLEVEITAAGTTAAVDRTPWAVLLLVSVAALASVVLFGHAFLPRSGRLSPIATDLTVQLRFAEGTSSLEANALVSAAEEILGKRPEVLEQWSVFTKQSARLGMRVVDQERPISRLRALCGQLEVQLSSLGASVQATPLAGASGQKPLRFTDELIEGPEVDESLSSYRMLLRSPDARALRRALEQIDEMRRRDRWLVSKLVVVPDWRAPTEHWLLVPRSDADPGQLTRAAELLAERAHLPSARPTRSLPGDPRPISMRVVSHGAPRDPEDVPELEDLLVVAPSEVSQVSEAINPEALFDLRQGLGSPTLKRQRGSFVLPITFHFQGVTLGERSFLHGTLNLKLHGLALPAGVDRELPRLERQYVSPEILRLVAIGATLPLLLFGLAVVRLDSLPLGLAAAAPPCLALVSAAPLLAASGGADELTWLTLAATFTAVWVLSAEVTAALRVIRPSPLAIAPGYRWLARRLSFGAVLAAAWAALLMVPTLGLASDRHAWITPLRAAALAGVAGCAASFLVLPVLLRTVDRLRFHDRDASRRAAHPIAWQTPGPLRLETRNLTKIYGNGFRGLSRIDVALEPGIIGLLGPNGAGKTTLLRCLCGLLQPTRGQVLFRGVPVSAENLPSYRRLVGFLPQSFNAYEGFTVEAFLDFWALERGLTEPKARRRELEKVLDQVGLAEVQSRKVRDLSGGMRRRIGIARALLAAPPILIVDEPTTGLDVESRNRLRGSLLAAAGERIILFSTHIASDIAGAASRILILDQGRLTFDGPAATLLDEAEGRVFEQLLDDRDLRDFSARYRVTTRVRTLEGLKVRAVAALGQEPAGPLVRPNLEEAYLAKLGKTPEVPGARRRRASLLDLDC